MKSFALSASHSYESLNYRGLSLLSEICNFTSIKNLSDYNIPIINTNRLDAEVPKDITLLLEEMHNYDTFIFAVPEMTGFMSAGFKNLLDWMVVSTQFNSKLGKNYPFSNKPVILLTFTPSAAEAGDRHFPTTIQIINKLGGNVVYSECFHDCWNNIFPNNINFLEKSGEKINHYLNYNDKIANTWQKKYDEWNAMWQ